MCVDSIKFRPRLHYAEMLILLPAIQREMTNVNTHSDIPIRNHSEKCKRGLKVLNTLNNASTFMLVNQVFNIQCVRIKLETIVS